MISSPAACSKGALKKTSEISLANFPGACYSLGMQNWMRGLIALIFIASFSPRPVFAVCAQMPCCAGHVAHKKPCKSSKSCCVKNPPALAQFNVSPWRAPQANGAFASTIALPVFSSAIFFPIYSSPAIGPPGVFRSLGRSPPLA